ncbi:DUF397 domain-containing protein [Streptomyces sp. NPDC093594]|uniref:DUF397 domain-containing protein n=1 Tax=Streptomyces sp. NPDC093594 TaxID=3155305 RepID=UPI00344D81A6
MSTATHRRRDGTHPHVRDSKAPYGPILCFEGAFWAAFPGGLESRRRWAERLTASLPAKVRWAADLPKEPGERTTRPPTLPAGRRASLVRVTGLRVRDTGRYVRRDNRKQIRPPAGTGIPNEGLTNQEAQPSQWLTRSLTRACAPTPVLRPPA